MPTLQDFSSEYADYIWQHVNSPTVATDVAKRIKGLSYTETGEPLSEPDIDALVDGIQEHLTHGKATFEGVLIKEAEDSTRFIEMVKAIRQEAKKK